MDELKLNKWQRDFDKAAKALQVEYDAYFLPKKFSETYRLELTESQSFSLVINPESLPKEIENRLKDIFIKTQPEDSV